MTELFRLYLEREACFMRNKANESHSKTEPDKEQAWQAGLPH